jgi:hypothetical protein
MAPVPNLLGSRSVRMVRSVLGWSLLVVAFVPMLLLMLLRMRVRHQPTLRLKENEEPKEAGVITLGAYRLYTWMVWAQVLWLVIGLMGGKPPLWLTLPTLVAQLALAHAIYWRLSFGWARFLLVLANLSPVVGLTEAYYFLRIELAPAEDARLAKRTPS